MPQAKVKPRKVEAVRLTDEMWSNLWYCTEVMCNSYPRSTWLANAQQALKRIGSNGELAAARGVAPAGRKR
jgi:hypothetical protein